MKKNKNKIDRIASGRISTMIKKHPFYPAACDPVDLVLFSDFIIQIS